MNSKPIIMEREEWLRQYREAAAALSNARDYLAHIFKTDNPQDEEKDRNLWGNLANAIAAAEDGLRLLRAIEPSVTDAAGWDPEKREPGFSKGIAS